MRKTNLSRPYAPDFVDAETLAYRLSCSERVLVDYVKGGLLPKPIKIGNLVRWDWEDVRSHIAASNGEQHVGQDDAAEAIEAAAQARKKALNRTA